MLSAISAVHSAARRVVPNTRFTEPPKYRVGRRAAVAWPPAPRCFQRFLLGGAAYSSVWRRPRASTGANPAHDTSFGSSKTAERPCKTRTYRMSFDR